MTAASSASAPARRVAAPARSASAPAVRAAQTAPAAAAVGKFDHHEDEFRLHLSDIPRMRESMEVEGLKPSLLSRLLDLIAPIKP